MKRLFLKFIHWFPLLSILCVSAYLRLYKISQYMTFLGDEGRDVLVVKRMIVDGKFTLLGPTASVGGFFMGPIYYYFMAPFLWVWRLDPVGPAIMVALVGIATVYLVYVVGNKWFSRSVGLMAAALYAVSPIVISFSRSSWNPNIVPFFALLSLYILWKAKEENKFSLLFWVGVCAGIGIQLHYTYLFLIVAEGIFIILSYKKMKIRDVALGLLGFVLGFAPFLAFELRHGFTNSRAIIEFVFAGKDTGFVFSRFISNMQDISVRLFGRFLLRIPEPGMLGGIPSNIRDPWKIAQVLLAIGGITSLILYGLQKRIGTIKRNINTFTLFCIWFIVPLVFFGIYKKNIYDYYFGMMFPLPFFLTALLIENIFHIKKIGILLGYVSIFGLIVFNWQGRPFIYPPNNQLRQVRDISQAVLDHTEGKPFNFALISPGNSDHAYRYFFEIWNKKPVVIENEVVDPNRQTVTDQLLIVCEDIFCQPLGNSLWEVAGFGRAEIAGVWDVSVVKIYKLVPYKGNP